MTVETFEDIGGKPTIDKDADAVLDYSIDLTEWLGQINPPTDTISDLSVSVTGGLVVDSTSFTNTKVTAWLSGGSPNVTASATYHFTTAQGREDDRTLWFRIKPR